MRLLIIQQDSSWNTLGTRLLQPGADGAATLARLKAANPHLDLNKLAAGSLLLVPNAPGVKADETQPVGGSAFDGFVADVAAGIAYASQRAGSGVEAITADRASVAGFLRAAPAKRLVESDPQLRKQVEDAGAQLKADQTQAETAAQQIATLQTQASAALQALGRLLQ